MSYSFTFKADSVPAAIERVTEEMDKVAAQQPAHEVDRDAVISAAVGLLNVFFPNPEGTELAVSCNGYVSGAWDGHNISRITQVSATVNVSLATIPAAAVAA